MTSHRAIFLSGCDRTATLRELSAICKRTGSAMVVLNRHGLPAYAISDDGDVFPCKPDFTNGPLPPEQAD